MTSCFHSSCEICTGVKINLFSMDALNRLKVIVMTLTMLESISNKRCFFFLSIERILENVSWFPQNLIILTVNNSFTVNNNQCNSDNNNTCFLNTKSA